MLIIGGLVIVAAIVVILATGVGSLLREDDGEEGVLGDTTSRTAIVIGAAVGVIVLMVAVNALIVFGLR